MQLRTNLLNLWTIHPERIYVRINSSFREHLFAKIIKKYSTLTKFSSITGINHETIRSYELGRNCLSLKDLSSFMHLCGVNLGLAKIEAIGYKRSKIIYKNFAIPNKVSYPELTSSLEKR